MAWLAEHFNRRVTYDSAEVALLGEIAFDRGTFTFTTTPKAGGQPSRTTGKYFWLIARASGTWKVTRMIVIVSRDDSADGDTGIDC